jgi:MFS family permease
MTYILPVALIPLVALPYELGFLADSKHGEKNILITGLLIMTITTFLCVIITSSNPLIWAMLLFTSRVGTSLAETMAHTYFFKRVGPEETSLTALFMNLRGVAIIVVGSVGFVIAPLLTTRPQLMFIILGCVILWGISNVLTMKEGRR